MGENVRSRGLIIPCFAFLSCLFGTKGALHGIRLRGSMVLLMRDFSASVEMTSKKQYTAKLLKSDAVGPYRCPLGGKWRGAPKGGFIRHMALRLSPFVPNKHDRKVKHGIISPRLRTFSPKGDNQRGEYGFAILRFIVERFLDCARNEQPNAARLPCVAFIS